MKWCGTSSGENGTIKCEKKNTGTIECDKSMVTPMLVLYPMWWWTVKCEKNNNNGPTKCEKSTIISIGIAQCDDGTVKIWRKK